MIDLKEWVETRLEQNLITIKAGYTYNAILTIHAVDIDFG
jgi:hypothetical protein